MISINLQAMAKVIWIGRVYAGTTNTQPVKIPNYTQKEWKMTRNLQLMSDVLTEFTPNFENMLARKAKEIIIEDLAIGIMFD